MPHILIVDDEPKILRLVHDFLTAAGFRTSLARSGDEALMRVRTAAPDLVILDLGLPGLDGYEVARQLRARGSTVQIIAVSGYGTDQDRAQSAAAGCDAHLLKPVDFDALCAQLATPSRVS